MVKSKRDKKKQRKIRNKQKRNKWEHAWESVTVNWPFWICCTICILLLVKFGKSGNCIPSAFITLIITMYLGYDVHRQSHERSVTTMYEKSDNAIIKYIREDIPIITPAINWFIYHCDFHPIVHHDSSVNKTLYNRLVEAYQNIMSEGLIVAFFVYNLKPSITIGNFTMHPHIPTIILWAILYTTVHNINYDILHPMEHVNHHLHPTTNYGMDLLDILFETKYETDSVEIMHHAIPNLILATLAIIQFQQVFSQ